MAGEEVPRSARWSSDEQSSSYRLRSSVSCLPTIRQGIADFEDGECNGDVSTTRHRLYQFVSIFSIRQPGGFIDVMTMELERLFDYP